MLGVLENKDEWAGPMCHVSDCVKLWLGVLENKDQWAGPMCHVSDCGWLYLIIRMSGRGLCVMCQIVAGCT